MKRRNFLKLCCAAVVAPALPIPSIEPALSVYDVLLRLIRQRMHAARQSLIDDIEEQYFVGIALEDIPKRRWGWIQVAGPINYKQ